MDDRERSGDRRTRDRNSDRHHRSHRDSDDHRHHHRSDRSHKRDHKSRDWEEDREGSRERSYDRDDTKGKDKVKRDEEEDGMEDSVEPRHSSHSHKRKDREHSEDRERERDDDKRIRVSEDRKRERRRFGDKAKKDEGNDDTQFNNGNEEHATASVQNGTTALGSPAVAPTSVPETSLAPTSSSHIKVSSISTTNENKGVSITRSHEVTGKSSTDGSSSTAGKPGRLNIEVIAKAKLALQKQKELHEKLKNLPLSNKISTPNNESTVPSLSVEKPSSPAPLASSGPVASMSIFPNAAAATSTLASPAASGTSAAGVPNYEAVRRAQELAARMGFRQDPQFAPLINMFPGQMVPDVTIPQKPTKAPVLRLDAQGREIDEHGNVVNVTKPSNLSTLKVNINKQKKDAFEILKPVLDVDPDSNPHFDPRMGVNKTKLLRPKRNNFLFKRFLMAKPSSADSRTRSSVQIFIVVGLCCFFYILGTWQRSGFGKGDSVALEITKKVQAVI